MQDSKQNANGARNQLLRCNSFFPSTEELLLTLRGLRLLQIFDSYLYIFVLWPLFEGFWWLRWYDWQNWYSFDASLSGTIILKLRRKVNSSWDLCQSCYLSSQLWKLMLRTQLAMLFYSTTQNILVCLQLFGGRNAFSCLSHPKVPKIRFSSKLFIWFCSEQRGDQSCWEKKNQSSGFGKTFL